MKNLLDYGLGLFPNEFALQDVYRNAESIIDAETDQELRAEMVKTFREWKLVNLKFGRLLRKQDERMFSKKSF
jgi:hypothetical protein